jgi:hypothetical protein
VAKGDEVCGFPIGPSKKCVLPKGHVPSAACSATPLGVKELVCPGCSEVFKVARVLVCVPSGAGIAPVEARIPVHFLPGEVRAKPRREGSMFSSLGSGPPPSQGTRCPGA